MKKYLIIGAGMLPLAACTDSGQQQEKPNVIFIIADDLGYGDLSCYGQERFQTPNIDSLAADGVIFTRHYAGTSVSAPSRSSLITGLHTGHTPIRGNKELPTEGQYPIPGDTYNVFRLMKSQGYVTGVFGKWGLGAPATEGAPENQGVDEFYGYNCQRLAHHYFPYHLWHNTEKVMLNGNEGTAETEYSPYLIHSQALDFIRENSDSTFFMMYTSVIPHAELRLPEEEIEPFLGKFEPEKSYKGCDGGPGYRQAAYGSQEHCHAAFAAMVNVLDRQVGELRALLDSLGISDNTIVIFTSDNGPHIEGGADPAYFNSNGGLRGIKRDLYEGGIRVPFIMAWPGHIEGGRTTDHVSAFWDFLPTLADITGAELPDAQRPVDEGTAAPAPGHTSDDTGCPVPCSYITDGISFLPAATGQGEQPEHEYLYWEFHEAGGRRAILQGDWKGVIYDYRNGGAMQLYNLAEDPAEQHDVAADHPDIVSRLSTLLESARTPSPIPEFN